MVSSGYTLQDWLDFAKEHFGRESGAVKFLEDKIAEQSKNARVMADDHQFMMILVEQDRREPMYTVQPPETIAEWQEFASARWGENSEAVDYFRQLMKYNDPDRPIAAGFSRMIRFIDKMKSQKKDCMSG